MPLYRITLRHYNSSVFEKGKIWKDEFKISEFCLDVLDNYFPHKCLNYIWIESHNFYHVEILRLIDFALSYGFFTGEDCIHLVRLINKFCKRMNKLEHSWHQKIEKEKLIYENWRLNKALNHNKSDLDDNSCDTDFDEEYESEISKKYEEIIEKERKNIYYSKLFNDDSILTNRNLDFTPFSVPDKAPTQNECKISQESKTTANFRSILSKQGGTNEFLVIKKWKDSDWYKIYENKVQEFYRNLLECKSKISCILIQIITLFSDNEFDSQFREFSKQAILSKLSTTKEEQTFMERQKKFIQDSWSKSILFKNSAIDLKTSKSDARKKTNIKIQKIIFFFLCDVTPIIENNICDVKLFKNSNVNIGKVFAYNSHAIRYDLWLKGLRLTDEIDVEKLVKCYFDQNSNDASC